MASIDHRDTTGIKVFSSPIQHAEWGSKEWANEQLRFAIGVLQGKRVGSQWKGRLQLALMIKDRLLAYGFSWQASRIENWIHRLQPRKADALKKEEGDSS